MWENIVAGLASGLFVSFIVLVLSKLWKTVIEPWFEEKVYKDLKIEGRWFSLYIDSLDYRQESINLKRHGHFISGTMMCKTGADDGEEYAVEGSFRNMLLPISYESSDQRKSDRGTITLKSSFNGQRLVGKVAMYETQRDRIETARVIWFREKQELEQTIQYIQAHRAEMNEMKDREDAIGQEFAEFFKDVAKEYAEKKKKEHEQTIEGEVVKLESKG